MRVAWLLLAILLAAAPAWGGAPVVKPEIVGELPHDEDAFTQGLFVHQGLFYESVGLRGRSRLRLVEPKSGRQIAANHLPPDLFAEGADLCGDEVVQLTWTAGRALRYDPGTLRKLGEFSYQGEGWGIACHGGTMVTSDGGATLTLRDMASFEPTGELIVRDAGELIQRLNELEWADGLILANVWKSPRIAAIDPQTGEVRFWLDMSEAVRRSGRTDGRCVLNGIAWDESARRLYVTGKCWDRIYAIEWPPQAPMKDKGTE